MSKIVLNDVVSGANVSVMNDNFTKIETALNEKVLYRDNPTGEPNNMLDDLDMNSNRIYNLPKPVNNSEPVRLQDLTSLGGNVTNAGSVTIQDAGNYFTGTTVEEALQELGPQLLEINPRSYGAKGDGINDDTSAIQAALDAAGSNVAGNAKAVHLTAGKYKTTAPLLLKYEYITMYGDGPYESQILPSHTGSAITTPNGQNYIRPFLRDFGIMGGAGSGHGLDFGNLQKISLIGQCYLGELRNIIIYSGGTCLNAPGASNNPQFFSMQVSNVSGYSYNSHCFHIWSGPGNTFEGMYALRAPAGKCGYRMTGQINLENCNGLNDGDIWAVFGSEPSGTDGFQNDFGGTDYPAITLENCNVERFGSYTTGGIGIKVVQLYRNFEIIGGSCQRADTDIPQGVNSYKALIYCKYGSQNPAGNPVKIGWSAVYLRDVINGTGSNTPSNAHLYAEFNCKFEDTSHSLDAVNIKSFRINSDSLSYPILINKNVNDIYGGWAYGPTAIVPNRLTVKYLRYDTGATIVPVFGNTSIDVTGRTKVIVSPSSAVNISTATFLATPGDNTTDYGRNGDLIIEAGNGNLTIVHSASGANTFKMLANGNFTFPVGGIRKFVRSETTSQWVEV